jgi:hypothetical protein
MNSSTPLFDYDGADDMRVYAGPHGLPNTSPEIATSRSHELPQVD